MHLFTSVTSVLIATSTAIGSWNQLPPLPDKEGFAGSFAGVSGGALLVAGGANFPDKKPWEGGTKVWYETVFVLDRPGGQWKIAGKLPRPLGYGVAVTYKGSLVCVGGSDTERHYADAFRLDWTDGKLTTTALPPLPRTVANACGAVVGDSLYIAGGQEKPDSTQTLRTFFCINLASKSPKWQEVDPVPVNGRMLSVAASVNGAFYLGGGTDLVKTADGKVERRYLKDFFRYHPDEGWTMLEDLPRPVVAAPTPAPADASAIHILGGDDGSQVGVTPDRHKGFATKTLRFDLRTGKWSEGSDIAAPRVTTPCTLWDKSWIIPTGEMRPGIRSPQVWSYVLDEKDRAAP